MTSEVRQTGQGQGEGLRRLTVGLGWQVSPGGGAEPDLDLDLSACLLSEGGRIPGERFFVFYNNLASPDGGCLLSEDGRTGAKAEDEDVERLSVDVTRLDARVTSLVLSVSIHDAGRLGQRFGQAWRSYVRLCDADSGEELCRFELSEDFAGETAIEFGRLEVREGVWRFEPTGLAHPQGLRSIVDAYC
ncbi:MAG: TerD family protein [Oligosphaeraceae bacterium]